MYLKVLLVHILALLYATNFTAQSLVINEVSQGPAGSEEYVELLVVPDPSQIISCTEILPCLDLRGWIFDDNNGYFSGGAMSLAGIAPGACRFANDPFWACIPVGTIIVIYNDSPTNTNGSLPSDDNSLIDANCSLVIPISSTLFDRVTTFPDFTDMTYPLTGWVAGGSWQPIGMRNSGDSFQIYNPYYN